LKNTQDSFSLLASLRIQLNKANQSTFNVTPERAFADFVFAHIILHLVVINFIG
jgi:oligosaccharyltransferase complex subunit epsilon